MAGMVGALSVRVKDLVSIARIRNAFITYKALAQNFSAYLQTLVLVPDIKLEAATPKVYTPLVAGVQGPSIGIWNRPHIVICIARENLKGNLADFQLSRDDEAIG
jgi:hypothetical protein